MTDASTFTAFAAHRLIATGELVEVAVAVASKPEGALIFDDATGALVELDLRHGAERAVQAYRARTTSPETPSMERQGRGRPRLGVVAREVTLLPRHWDWLARQPGGASAALRRLVDDARRVGSGSDEARRTRDSLYRIMSAVAGDLPGFEEATRALFAGDERNLRARVQAWPPDITTYFEARLDRSPIQVQGAGGGDASS